MYFASRLVLILLLNAWQVFSEFLLEVKTSLVLCKAKRLSVTILFVSDGVKAWGLSLNIEGSFGF